ncbi:Polycystin-1 [Collichthys lucidus]|uniref:Polycystin-1 n=1 Tax=Collichthys lucidus TaxID=240159 RepID=A0A4U5VP83_COLLU|nr:Polycystin-1 [Collichthys lucidus]
MTLGTQGRWRKAQCAGQYLFLCEKDITESLPSVNSYLTGLVLMTGIYAQIQIQPFPNAPDTGQLTVEMQLFPGVWFSHAGQLESVELVVQPSPVSSLARVQILRPYCNPNHHLVPPGCSSLLNPFSCCSAVPLCSTTGGCSMGQYWCHLMEACVRTTSPCSPYDSAVGGRGFALPPRYLATPPFYHLVADMPLRTNPNSALQTISLLLPDRAIMVYPDDIVAIQHTRDSGTFLHCLNGEASLNSPWRQSYMSFRKAEWGGWWEGGLSSLPQGGQWVDRVVCDLRMLYVDNLNRVGVKTLNITVMDAVNSQSVNLRVCGYEAVTGLSVEPHGCLRMLIETPQSFIAKVESGSSVKFTWVIDNLEKFAHEGESYSVVFKKPAEYKLKVTASNPVSSESQQIHPTADEMTPLSAPEFLLLREVIAVDATNLYTIRVKVDISLPVTFRWDFGDGSSKVIHNQSAPCQIMEGPMEKGEKEAYIQDSVTYTYSIPDLSLHTNQPYAVVGEEILISAISSAISSTNYYWTVENMTSTKQGTYQFRFAFLKPGVYQVRVIAQNLLYIEVEEPQCSNPQASLVQSKSTIFRSRPSYFEASININCSAYKAMYLWEIFKESDCTDDNLKFSGNKVILRGTPLLAQRKTTITVVHSPLIAVIKGGSHRLWRSLSDLILDGSESQDPDIEPGVEDTLQYHWTFMKQNSTESHFGKQHIGSNSSKMNVLSKQLHPGSIYLFTLTVHKAGRQPASINQTVTVCEAPVLPVAVECVSCSILSSPHHISYTNRIVLSGQCEQCDDQTQYKWSAEDQAGMDLDLSKVTTSTARHSPNLEVRSGVLQPGQSYTFTLNVSQPDRGRWGSASLMLLPNNPPHGGRCDLSPESDIKLLETVVTYNCSGWQDDESSVSQLIYTLQVAPCQPVGTLCPLLTLYRVKLLVSGSETRVQTELWALVQHGNPQEIIPYSIALTSQLNQMESGQSAWELMDRREIRENVTQALASLPVSSLLDVDQISSALSQSTAVPSELVCENCQQRVLEAVGKMIHVMEEQMSPGVQAAVETGRNILNIIGSTLAAVSESVSASGSHPDYSGTLESASIIALSVIGHAGALMRSLMSSQLHGESPLTLSTPYINTVGFHGDPSHLLCTPQSNQTQINPSRSSLADELKSSHPCQFHIPTSLTAHLKSQESEVVQVLFGMDAGLESIPLLTAADPPISTNLVAMELTTPQGQPIPIQDLHPEQAIRVTLPNKYPMRGVEDGDGGMGEAGNGTCLTVTLPAEGRLNFTVKAVDGLDENAGLYISFNFSLHPGDTPVSLGHVKIEVSSAGSGTNASQDSLVRERALALSASTTSTEESIFLSPLSLCQYYSVKERRWSSEGLQPLEGSTLHAAHCLTQHLTMFGASLFVHPGAVVLLPPSDGPIRNTVAAIVCAILVLIHLLLGLIAHKLDHLDGLRMSQVPLCGRPGLYQYRVLVKTGWRRGAGTTAHVGISLYGVNKSGSRHLQRDGAFQRGSLDQFHLETDDNLGEVWKIRIWHDNTGLDPSWYVQHVVVWDPQTDHMFFFLLEDWLSVENQKNGTVEKEVLASCPEELSQFRRVFASQLIFGMVEHHLWLSLWERPAHSHFTRSQRITCSALVLHLYLALGGSVLLESKAFDSSILEFWAASGLAPQIDGAYQEGGVRTWPSCDSLLNFSAGPYLTKTTLVPTVCKASPALGPIRQLKRKKALMQLRLASPSSTDSSSALHSPLSKDITSSHQSLPVLDQKVSTMNVKFVQAHSHNLTTLLTLSGEKIFK